jgi:hypothetical protein
MAPAMTKSARVSAAEYRSLVARWRTSNRLPGILFLTEHRTEVAAGLERAMKKI